VNGAELTPWLLHVLAQATGGRAIETNLALLEANARLGGELAVELSRREASSGGGNTR
jgi:pseudouridine-5'-phosphate glycosidase